jgi:hypothetical protein
MADSKIILDNIRWDIRDLVANAERKLDGEDPQWKTGNLLSQQDLDAPVFSNVDEDYVSIRFFVDDSWSVHVDRQISTQVSIRSLLTFIRDFYAEPMGPEIYESVSANNDEIPEYDSYFTNVNAFDDMMGLPFEGLEHHGGILYEVLIGPI